MALNSKRKDLTAYTPVTLTGVINIQNRSSYTLYLCNGSPFDIDKAYAILSKDPQTGFGGGEYSIMLEKDGFIVGEFD